VEKVAEKATKAAPALAVTGVLVAGPPAQHLAAAAATAKPSTAAVQVVHARLDAVVRVTRPRARATTYTVQSGDTLSGIAQRLYGQPADWPSLYHANQSQIPDPDLVYPGERLRLPSHPSASSTYQPRHARASSATHTTQGSGVSSGSSSGSSSGGSSGSGSGSTGLSGTLSCGGLEELWEEAGGSASAAVTAASIAMAESGGNQYATGSVGERGYWQINPVNGALSTYDAYGNARAAVVMSSDGTNWSPWTTWTSGAYAGRC